MVDEKNARAMQKKPHTCGGMQIFAYICIYLGSEGITSTAVLYNASIPETK